MKSYKLLFFLKLVSKCAYPCPNSPSLYNCGCLCQISSCITRLKFIKSTMFEVLNLKNQISRVNRKLSALDTHRNRYILYFLFIVLKLSQITYLWVAKTTNNPEIAFSFLAFKSGDTASYINPILNYFETGEYFWWNGSERIYAGRMPLYGLFFYVFYWISPTWAFTLTTMTQLLIELFSTYLLALTSVKLTKSRVSFFSTFTICAVSFVWTNHSLFVSPESLNLSIISISIYFYYKWRFSLDYKWVALTGLMVSLLIFIKPYMGILAAFYCLDAVIFLKLDFKRSFKITFLIWLPIALSIFPWTIRNYQVTNDAIP